MADGCQAYPKESIKGFIPKKKLIKLIKLNLTTDAEYVANNLVNVIMWL